MRKRGIALVLVLTVASVIVMMTGAFVIANAANFNTLSASQRQREADLVTQSAVQFVYYQLENNQTFAQDPFTDNFDVSLPGGGLQVTHVKGQRSLTGALLDEGTGRQPTFKADIYNNLNVKVASPGNFDVPLDAVLIRIEGRSGAFTSRCDVLYRGEPLYDASVTANKMVDLSSNANINIYSKDRSRNWLRSNENIKLNDFANSNGSHTVIHPDDSGGQGVIWAKGDITSGSSTTPLSGQQLAKASALAQGVLAPKSRLNHDIYKLTADDLSVWKDSVKKGQQTWGAMLPGTYSIDMAKVYWVDGDDTKSAEVKTVSYTPDDPKGDKIVWYDGRNIGENLILPQGWGVQSYRSNAEGIVKLGVTNQSNGMGGDVAAMTFNFDKDSFVADNSSIEVEGNLRITSKLDGVVPTIALKSDDYSSGVIRTTKGGSITVQGELQGGGALVAEGDVKIMCNPKWDPSVGIKETNVTANKSAGVVLFGQNVDIYGGSNRNVQFKGLIYAEKDVGVWGGMAVTTEGGNLSYMSTNDKLDHLNIQGAVVARTGTVNIAQTNDVSLTYDQEYLAKLTKGMPDNRRRIAHVWTRTY